MMSLLLLRSFVFGAKAGEDFFSRDAIPAVCALLNVSAQCIELHRSELLTVFKYAQALANDLARAGIAPLPNLALDESLEVFSDVIA